MTAAIEASGLVKTYKGGVKALDGLSFSVEAGTIFGLLGPNGAGKTTTVKILSTLSQADSGSASVAGFDVRRSPNQVRHAIGFVSQKSGIDLESNGRENLTLQGRLYGMGGRRLTARVDGLLERFGLADAAGRITRTYSGGMQRRLDIAMGVVHEPQVLFLDEPTAGLDPEFRTEMWEEIARMRAQDRLTILLTTHYLEEADRLADRVAIIDMGKLVTEGTPEELKSNLHGDAVHVELAEIQTNGHVSAALDRLTEVRDIILDGKVLHARSDNGARAVPIVLQALEAHQVSVASVTVARPSLDDVYLRYTGRTFAKAEAEAATEGQK